MLINYLELTKQIILKHIDNNRYFGSRAYSNARHYSDIDVGVVGKDALSSIILSNIESELDESIVPYKVEIVNFTRVSDTFNHYAIKKTVAWN